MDYRKQFINWGRNCNIFYIMRKTLTICITLLLLNSCNKQIRYNTFIINSKSMGTYGTKYTYKMDFNYLSSLYLYSDSAYEIGDTLKLTK